MDEGPSGESIAKVTQLAWGRSGVQTQFCLREAFSSVGSPNTEHPDFDFLAELALENQFWSLTPSELI